MIANSKRCFRQLLIFVLFVLFTASKSDNFQLRDVYSLSGSEYLGKGFDYIQGTLFCYTTECLSEGFNTTNIFNLEYYTNSKACTIKDIPRGSVVSCANTATVDSQTLTFNSLQRLSVATTESEGTDIGYRKAFSASQSYTISKYTQAINIQDSTVFHSYYSITSYILSISNIKEMKFSPEFQQAVASLPVAFVNSTYINFIQKFGLSYVSSMVLGGRAQEIVYMTNQQVLNYQSTGKSATEAASVHFLINVGASTTNTNIQSDQSSFSSSMSSNETYFFGGKPGINNLTAWVPTVQGNTVPLKVSLEPIYQLLTSFFFPNDPNIAAKQANFLQAVDNYYPPPIPTCPSKCQNGGNCTLNQYMNTMYCDCTNTNYFGSTCSIPNPIPSS